jgi:hypothetical protein
LVPSSAFATAEILQFGRFTWLVAPPLSIAHKPLMLSLKRCMYAGPKASKLEHTRYRASRFGYKPKRL